VDLPIAISRTLGDQCGVIARRQVLAGGWSVHDIDRMVRRREWVRLLPGVYVCHTGEPTWLERAWAGVLYYWPSALAGLSALRAAAGPGWRPHDDSGPIWIAVAAARHVADRDGYRVRWLAGYDVQVLEHTHPPRMRFEEACLDAVVATKSKLRRIHLLADACQSRRTTADRLLTAMANRTRVPDRRWLEAILRDIAEGTCSVLEHGYLTRVERPHGLPRGRRQRTDCQPTGRIYRDVVYENFDLYVELDGRLFHDSSTARDDDLERDLDAATVRHDTVRLGWGQVFGRPCQTAAKVGTILTNGGWTGTIQPCGPACEASRHDHISEAATHQVRRSLGHDASRPIPYA
jgi:hypothetical protein